MIINGRIGWAAGADYRGRGTFGNLVVSNGVTIWYTGFSCSRVGIIQFLWYTFSEQPSLQGPPGAGTLLKATIKINIGSLDSTISPSLNIYIDALKDAVSPFYEPSLSTSRLHGGFRTAQKLQIYDRPSIVDWTEQALRVLSAAPLRKRYGWLVAHFDAIFFAKKTPFYRVSWIGFTSYEHEIAQFGITAYAKFSKVARPPQFEVSYAGPNLGADIGQEIALIGSSAWAGRVNPPPVGLAPGEPGSQDNPLIGSEGK